MSKFFVTFISLMLIFTLVLAVGATYSAAAAPEKGGLKDLEITVFADLHAQFKPCDYSYDSQLLDPNERLQLILDEAIRWNADVLLNLGDFSTGFVNDYELDILNMWNSFPNEKIAVHGNHDTAGHIYLEKMGMPSAYYYKDLPGGWRIIVLDSGTPPSESGKPNQPDADARQMAWFENVLAATPERCIIAIHYYVLFDGGRLDIRPFIAKANKDAGYTKVVACLYGHTHYPSYKIADGGTHYIEINSASYRWLYIKGPERRNPGPKFYLSVPFANITLRGDGSVIVQGFGEKNRWAVSESNPNWIPPDDKTYQASKPK